MSSKQERAAKLARSGRPASAIAEVSYDDSARQDYLTGFHKRKLEKKKVAIAKYSEKMKEERRELRRENNKRHLILEDLERIEAVTQERAAAANEIKERAVNVSTIPSSTRLTTVTISDWNPEELEEEEDDQDESDGGGKSKIAEKKKAAVVAKKAVKKARGVTKVRTKPNPHTRQAKEAKSARKKEDKKKRQRK
ncbi:hypothetical protein HKX48_005463 [Thoreauomyces humboldtii]|nr:hypothetical protein HKX48_005463 [Thoreauomyces humboldtii]